MLLYKLRARQSRGAGAVAGRSAGCSRAGGSSPARGWSRGWQGHKGPPEGKKWGWGHGLGTSCQHTLLTAGQPRLAPSKATLATCLLAASNKWHVPGASPAGEREKERLGGLRSSSEVGGKLGPCCLKFHRLKRLPHSARSCWSHSTLNAPQASAKASAALFLKSQGHLAGLGKTWGQIPYKH